MVEVLALSLAGCLSKKKKSLAIILIEHRKSVNLVHGKLVALDRSQAETRRYYECRAEREKREETARRQRLKPLTVVAVVHPTSLC